MRWEVLMLTITVPIELASLLSEEALRRGTTAELLALEAVRLVLPFKKTEPVGTMADFFRGYVGVVDGTTEPLSQDCSRRFADGLAADAS
jgi:hypothetical protein